DAGCGGQGQTKFGFPAPRIPHPHSSLLVMREQLIRYLLGELDEFEHEEVQRQLAANAELRKKLAHLRSCIAANCQDEAFLDEPPRDLVERTTELVTNGAANEPGTSKA